MNSRVNSFAVPGEQTSRQSQSAPSNINGSGDGADIDNQINQAYRQIFFHAFKVDRDPMLESQLRTGQITTRDFIRSLLLSRKFRDYFYRCNSNYRFVEQMVGRVLGRPVHGVQESIAYSILVAEQGMAALVDTLLNSEEYLSNFGVDTVPFQRSRILPGRAVGTMPFNQTYPRYESYWRDISIKRAPADSSYYQFGPRPSWLADAPSPLARKIWLNTIAAGGFGITALLLWIAAAMLSTGW